MKRRRLIQGLVSVPLLAAESAEQSRPLPTYRIVDEGWGSATTKQIQLVIDRSISMLWKYFPKRVIEPFVITRTRTGPMVHYVRNYRREIVMNLDTQDQFWCQYAYQFAHEFCHILAGFDQDGTSNLWFEEMLCETASLFTLRHLADAWRLNPPYPEWKSYATDIDRYAETVAKSRPKIASGKLAEFYRKNAGELRANPVSRALNGAMANVVLEMLEQSPERWESVCWLNSSRSAPNETFEFYLNKWLRAAPARHQPFIADLKRAFGVA